MSKLDVVFIPGLAGWVIVDESGFAISSPYAEKQNAIEEKDRLESISNEVLEAVVNTEIYNTIPDPILDTLPVAKIFIHRYELGSLPYIEMPAGAKIIHTYGSLSRISIWALVDSTQPIVKRRIAQIVTGQEIPLEDLGVFIATINLGGGQIRHLFDCGVVL
jgi:hypothetical protein